jgi:hypothetical protein
MTVSNDPAHLDDPDYWQKHADESALRRRRNARPQRQSKDDRRGRAKTKRLGRAKKRPPPSYAAAIR